MLGVPCNQFLWQEPAKETEIAAFCAVTYAVTFPMTEKTHVKGGHAHPYFKWMRERLGRAAHPAWNFHKLLTDKSGAPVAAFKSKVEPTSAELRSAIEKALRADRNYFQFVELTHRSELLRRVNEVSPRNCRIAKRIFAGRPSRYQLPESLTDWGAKKACASVTLLRQTNPSAH